MFDTLIYNLRLSTNWEEEAEGVFISREGKIVFSENTATFNDNPIGKYWIKVEPHRAYIETEAGGFYMEYLYLSQSMLSSLFWDSPEWEYNSEDKSFSSDGTKITFEDEDITISASGRRMPILGFYLKDGIVYRKERKGFRATDMRIWQDL